MLNKDAYSRDILIFGGYDEEKYLGGVRYFSTTPSLIKKLVELGFANPDERQNDSPSIQEFLDYVTGEEDKVLFKCYAVSPRRSDYRVNIEGVSIIIPHDNYNLVSYFVETFRDADEFSFEHDGEEYYLEAWWD